MGDATGKMHRLLIILNSLDRSAPKRPRRLGVTIPMLKWVSQQFAEGPEMEGQVKVDCRVMTAALLTAWFFMLRARGYCDSGGIDEEMILQGQDLQFSVQGEKVDGKAEEVTFQFRKTKSDQLAFGTCRTMTYLCLAEF